MNRFILKAEAQSSALQLGDSLYINGNYSKAIEAYKQFKNQSNVYDKITKFVQKNFDTDLAGDLGLTGRQRISVVFKINKEGNIVGVRSRATHPRLEEEAKRVIGLLPKMSPGKHKGKNVIVPYSLPIIFQVSE